MRESFGNNGIEVPNQIITNSQYPLLFNRMWNFFPFSISGSGKTTLMSTISHRTKGSTGFFDLSSYAGFSGQFNVVHNLRFTVYRRQFQWTTDAQRAACIRKCHDSNVRFRTATRCQLRPADSVGTPDSDGNTTRHRASSTCFRRSKRAVSI